jgi:hypothetical protein
MPAAKLLADAIDEQRKSIWISPTTQGHDAVQAEAVDPDWSLQTNQQLRDYLSDQFGNRFEVPVVDCRENICELQAAGQLGGALDLDTADFQRAIMAMRDQPWWKAIGLDMTTINVEVTSSPDGRPLFIVYIIRK